MMTFLELKMHPRQALSLAALCVDFELESAVIATPRPQIWIEELRQAREAIVWLKETLPPAYTPEDYGEPTNRREPRLLGE
jgi:hypothetical protein